MEKNVVCTDVDVTQIFNHDETPQFNHYGIDGTPSPAAWYRKVYVSKKIHHLLISTTENDVQNVKSLVDAYKLFEKYLTENSPVVVIGDSHSSRFDFDTLYFSTCERNKITPFTF